MKHVSISAVLLLSLSLTACSKTDGPPRDQAPPVAVPVAPAVMHDLPTPFEAGGVVRARAVARLVSRIMASVESVRVSPGDRVRSGQALVVLDGRDLRANRDQAAAAHAGARESAALAAADVGAAEAGLNLARLTFQRIRELQASKSATQQELDEAEAQLKAAESRLNVAKARAAGSQAGILAASAGATSAEVAASFATVVAPFDGLVTEKLVDPGNMASPGMPLVTVEDTRSFRLEVRLDESRALMVSVGDDVEVMLDAAATVRAKVAEVSRMLDPGSHDFVVKIELPSQPGLKTGMFARAVFRGPVHRALVVPEAAVVRSGQLSYLFVVEDSTAHLRLINAGAAVDGLVDVRSGLNEGEQVVTRPPLELTDGRAVTATAELRR